jgi:DNA-binding NtrC family response regulator
MLPHYKGTILLVEDDARLRENLAVVFRSAGYETLRVATAEKGLAVLETYKVHLVVLDYKLPGMNGLHFFETMLSDEKYVDLRQLPVVVMTGYEVPDEEKQRFVDLGAKAFITKATGFYELKRIVDQEVEAYKAVINFNRDPGRLMSLPEYLAYIEKQIILRTIIRNPNASQDAVAKELGIPRSTLSRKMADYNLRLR